MWVDSGEDEVKVSVLKQKYCRHASLRNYPNTVIDARLGYLVVK